MSRNSKLQYLWAAVMVALLGACKDSPIEPDVPGAATAMVAASGVTFEGVAHSSHTLQVRVTDAKGRSVQGVVVNWKVASGGGSVSSATSTTDAAGIASANWTLGAFADEQKVTAESNRLSTISFTGTVPVATFTISPVEVKLWPGDKTQLSPQAKDATGTILEGVKPTWSTSQPAVVTVVEDKVLVALAPGVATVRASFRSIEASVNATILPIVRVKAWSLDETDVSGQRATVEWGGKATAAPVVAMSPYGEAVLRLDSPVPESASVRIRVDAENAGARRYHPAVIEVKGGELPTEVKVGLMPLRFTIPFGCFAGQTVDVSARAVLTPADEYGSFYYRDPKKPEIFGLSPEVLPMKVGIELTDGATAEDADSVWAALQGLEQCVWPGGAGTLYQRVDPAELTGNGLRVKFDFSLYASSGGPAGWPDVSGGRLTLAAAPSTRPQELWYLARGHFQHEAIHALGFNHSTGEYPSLMGSVEVTGLTAHDVAYIRLMQLAYELRKAHGIPAENFFTAAARGEELFGR